LLLLAVVAVVVVAVVAVVAVVVRVRHSRFWRHRGRRPPIRGYVQIVQLLMNKVREYALLAVCLEVQI
jgi:hypothetical protein